MNDGNKLFFILCLHHLIVCSNLYTILKHIDTTDA